MDIRDNYQAMNRLKVYTGAQIDSCPQPASYVLECKARKIVKLSYAEIENDLKNQFGKYFTIEKIFEKFLRMEGQALKKFINIAETNPTMAIIELMKRKPKKINNGKQI